MGKKLLILVGKAGEKKKIFADYIQKGLPKGDKVDLVEFPDLTFFINGKEIEVEILNNKGSLKDYSFVYFRRAGLEFPSLAGTIAILLDYLGIGYVDRIYENLGPMGDKFTSLVRLSLAGLPMIPTYFCWHTKIKECANEIVAKLGLPLVAKQLSSQKGRGVLLLEKPEDFTRLEKEFPKEEFLFQKYIPSDEEYRALVLEEEMGAFERKIRTVKGEFRSNVALGAREEFIDIAKTPVEIKEIAVKACKILNIQIGGVDILVEKEGRPWLLEVNRGPGLTYDPKISPELASLAKYFTRKMDDK
jgi:D-alanine-D-alanine ligase-like ATP-grasp enzyme